jgi:hypothetical protein
MQAADFNDRQTALRNRWEATRNVLDLGAMLAGKSKGMTFASERQ